MAFCYIRIMKFILIGVVALFSLSFVMEKTLYNYDDKKESAKKDKNKIRGEKFLKKNAKKSGVVTLKSGLQYKILTAGTGEKPTKEDEVKVHYTGVHINGNVFDSSVEKGEPAIFGVTQVIQGWVEALQLMPVGSKWEIYIPSNLAYGANPRPGGPIKPNEVLIFEVELLEIID